MKKTVTFLLALSTLTVLAGASMDEMKIHSLDTKSKTLYSNLITRVRLNKDLSLDLSQDDDIYFQNGKVVTGEKVDMSQSFCQLDTDVEKDNYTALLTSVSNGVLVMKKGLIRAIGRVDVSPRFEKGLIEYEIEFIRSAVKSANEVVDELECSVPLTTQKALTVKDVKDITGNTFSFDILDIEGN